MQVIVPLLCAILACERYALERHGLLCHIEPEGEVRFDARVDLHLKRLLRALADLQRMPCGRVAQTACRYDGCRVKACEPHKMQ